MWSAMLALMDGDLHGAEAANTRLRELAGKDGNLLVSWAGQLAYLRCEQGRLDEIIPMLQRHAQSFPGRSLLAFILGERGAREEARVLFDDLLSDQLAVVPDNQLSGALSQLTNVCARLGDRDAAAALLEPLLPFEGQLLEMTWGVVCPGAADRHLAMLEVLLDRHADADRHFGAAVELEERARAPALAARTRLWWARSLLDRGEQSASRAADDLLRSCAGFARERGLIALTDESEALLATRS
jgi:tetratricopeptide (TPR) repeat protein